MPISLRLPPFKEEIIKRIAQKYGKTKTAVIMEAIDEKIGLVKDRKAIIHDLAGWMSTEEAEDLKNAVEVFNRIEEGDWK